MSERDNKEREIAEREAKREQEAMRRIEKRSEQSFRAVLRRLNITIPDKPRSDHHP